MKWGVCLFVVACALVAEFSHCQGTDGYGTGPGRGQGSGRGGDRDRGQGGGRGEGRGRDEGRGRGEGRGEGRGRGGHGEGPRYRRDASPGAVSGRVRPDRSNSTLYRWTRNLAGNSTVQEAASSLNNKQIVIVMSYDVKLLAENITRAATLYHYVNGTKIVVIKPRLRVFPCMLIDTTLTYEDVIAELKSRNGSDVTVIANEALDATGPGLDDDERAQLFNKSNAVAVQCKWRDIVQAKPVAASPAKPEADTKDITVLTLDKELNLSLLAKPRNSKFRRPFLRGSGRPRSDKRPPK